MKRMNLLCLDCHVLGPGIRVHIQFVLQEKSALDLFTKDNSEKEIVTMDGCALPLGEGVAGLLYLLRDPGKRGVVSPFSS
jgi:hypothetical protein